MRIDRLPREQDPELARLIALAFHDYPPFRHIHQPLSGEAYRAVLEQNFAYYIALTRAVDDPVLGAWDEEGLVGGVLVYTPDTPEWTDTQENITRDFCHQISPESRTRLLAFEAMLDKHEPVPGVPCFYIDTLAVHPDSQGKGYARSLVDYVADLSHRHSTSAAVCLSTEDDRNHAFYERLGFEKESQLTLGTITSTAFKLLNQSPETR